jgi:hypothetical protein
MGVIVAKTLPNFQPTSSRFGWGTFFKQGDILTWSLYGPLAYDMAGLAVFNQKTTGALAQRGLL